MKILSFQLRVAPRHIRLLVEEGGVESGRDLEGEKLDAVLKVAAPLLAAAQARLPAGATLREITVESTPLLVRLGHAPGGESSGLILEGKEALALPVDDAIDAACEQLGLAGRRVSDPAYWEAIYRSDSVGWELGAAAPPLARAFATLGAPGRAVVVGCGRGHEARALAALGHDVVGIDFATEAVSEAREIAEKEGSRARFEQRDLFTLPGEHAPFALWVEHTCFCAIDPARRGEYVGTAASSLSKGGTLLGLFYVHDRPGGPPHTTTREEVERLFAPSFEIVSLEVPPDSIPRRAGHELLATMKRR